MSDILFYSNTQEYYQFSNFHRSPFFIDGVEYRTVENYYQCMKFPHNPDYQERIRSSTPMIAKRLGNSRKISIREDWESVKFNTMIDAVYAKFSQNDDLMDLLLSTGNRNIREHSKDRYWGDGLDNTGINSLGIILMVLRKLVRIKRKSSTRHT